MLDPSIKLHRQFGVGLLESVCETLLEKVLAAHFPFKISNLRLTMSRRFGIIESF
jgi:hypothetical protein